MACDFATATQVPTVTLCIAITGKMVCLPKAFRTAVRPALWIMGNLPPITKYAKQLKAGISPVRGLNGKR
jgi:hypothetical protein